MSKIEKALNKAATNRRNKVEQHNTRRQEPESTITQPLIYTKTLVHSTVSIDLLEKSRLLGGTEESELRDNINLLRTQILQKTRSMGWSTIMVTSPNAKSGKTTIATNLAISLARELNHTALLVDACIQKPELANRLGIDAVSGLSDYLLHQTPLENILINPGIEKLVILPGGTPVQSSTELLGSSLMKQLVTELKHRYSDRYIIFDTPQVVDMPDALVISEYVDAILLVVSDSETQTDDLRKTLDLLSNRNLLGLVLNKVR